MAIPARGADHPGGLARYRRGAQCSFLARLDTYSLGHNRPLVTRSEFLLLARLG